MPINHGLGNLTIFVRFKVNFPGLPDNFLVAHIPKNTRKLTTGPCRETYYL